MHKKKRYGLLLGFFAALLVLAACTADQKNETPTSRSPFEGGEKGIVGEFREFGIIDKSDIEEIFSTESFPIEVVLKNKGEHDIDPGDVAVSLTGINLADFSGIPNRQVSNENEIERVSDVNADGGEEVIDFTPGEDNARYLPQIIGNNVDITVVGNIVARYKTYVTVPKACFKGDLKDKSFCEVDEDKTVFSSGAPIQVKRVRERPSGTGLVVLEFFVENAGQGKVTKHGTEFDARIHTLEFEISEPEKWDCSGRGRANELRLDSDGKGSIVCKLKDSAKLAKEDLFTKEVALTLDYDYKDTIVKQLRIKKEE
ncbi:hypothetical protein HYV81_00010 [Candidatus Woesearchaeota archaeon]|nr:hypothetical protein [Candidatus Woesearchaeota archaeon]